jgi:Spy/CpxP family protein refolding chaperone
MMVRTPRLFFLGLLLASGHAWAQSAPAPLPAWEKLTPEQREALIAPVRDRWNREPDERGRMMERAQRWQALTPEQRAQARHGMKRFEGMSPDQRRQARALYGRMKTLTPEQRADLREQWKKMTPEQREAWMRDNAPPPRDRDRRPDR